MVTLGMASMITLSMLCEKASIASVLITRGLEILLVALVSVSPKLLLRPLKPVTD